MAKIWLVRFPIGIPRPPPQDFVKGVATDNFAQKIEGFLVLDFSEKDGEEGFMVHAVKELHYIGFPDKTSRELVKESLGSLNRSEETFTNPAGPGIKDEGFVVHYVQEIIDETVNDSIPNTGDRDLSTFVIADRESAIAPVTIGAVVQISKKRKEILLEMVLEFMKFLRRILTFSERKPTFPDIL